MCINCLLNKGTTFWQAFLDIYYKWYDMTLFLQLFETTEGILYTYKKHNILFKLNQCKHIQQKWSCQSHFSQSIRHCWQLKDLGLGRSTKPQELMNKWSQPSEPIKPGSPRGWIQSAGWGRCFRGLQPFVRCVQSIQFCFYFSSEMRYISFQKGTMIQPPAPCEMLPSRLHLISLYINVLACVFSF